MSRPITDPARADVPPSVLAGQNGAAVEHPAPARPATGGPGPRLPARSAAPAGGSAGAAGPFPPPGDGPAPDPPGGAAVTGPVPSGGATRKRRPRRAPREPDETQFQKSVTDLADRLGIWWYHAYQPLRDKAGFPDLVLVGPKGVLFRELKDATRKPSDKQIDVGKRLTVAGADFAIWRPADMQSGRILRELQEIR